MCHDADHLTDGRRRALAQLRRVQQPVGAYVRVRARVRVRVRVRVQQPVGAYVRVRARDRVRVRVRVRVQQPVSAYVQHRVAEASTSWFSRDVFQLALWRLVSHPRQIMQCPRLRRASVRLGQSSCLGRAGTQAIPG